MRVSKLITLNNAVASAAAKDPAFAGTSELAKELQLIPGNEEVTLFFLEENKVLLDIPETIWGPARLKFLLFSEEAFKLLKSGYEALS